VFDKRIADSLDVIRATSEQIFSFTELTLHGCVHSIQPDAEILFSNLTKLNIELSRITVDDSARVRSLKIAWKELIKLVPILADESKAIDQSMHWPCMKELTIFDYNEPRLHQRLFQIFPRLEKLNVQLKNGIKEIGTDVFAQAVHLTHFELWCVEEFAEKWSGCCLKEHDFRGLESLKQLKISVNSVDCLQHIVHLPHLEVLDLSRSRSLEKIGLDTFAHLPNLKKLSLESCSINKIDMNAFEPLINLEELKLYGNSMKEVVPARGLTGKNKLNALVMLMHCDISLNQFRFLEQLDLFLNRLSELSVGQFKSLCNLKELNLGSSRLGKH
jgi:Leucine-rich repeat (LRR) protein